MGLVLNRFGTPTNNLFVDIPFEIPFFMIPPESGMHTWYTHYTAAFETVSSTLTLQTKRTDILHRILNYTILYNVETMQGNFPLGRDGSFCHRMLNITKGKYTFQLNPIETELTRNCANRVKKK